MAVGPDGGRAPTRSESRCRAQTRQTSDRRLAVQHLRGGTASRLGHSGSIFVLGDGSHLSPNSPANDFLPLGAPYVQWVSPPRTQGTGLSTPAPPRLRVAFGPDGGRAHTVRKSLAGSDTANFRPASRSPTPLWWNSLATGAQRIDLCFRGRVTPVAELARQRLPPLGRPLRAAGVSASTTGGRLTFPAGELAT
jgi:hypothetical protein